VCVCVCLCVRACGSNGMISLMASPGEGYLYRTVTWAVASYYGWDGFLEGLGGEIRTTNTNHQFILQTDQPVRFDAPMVVTDASLGSCLVFPATACKGGTLALYVFSLKQFQV
jgi:hypothetical protein